MQTIPLKYACVSPDLIDGAEIKKTPSVTPCTNTCKKLLIARVLYVVLIDKIFMNETYTYMIHIWIIVHVKVAENIKK